MGNQGTEKLSIVRGNKYSNSKGNSKAQAVNSSDWGDLDISVTTLSGQLPFLTNVRERPQSHFKDGDQEVKSQ